MPKKIWQYTIFKFQSDRLKDENYNLSITLDEARQNGECVFLAESELIRIINRLKNKEVDYRQLEEIRSEQKFIKRLPDSKQNRKRLTELEKEKDSYLFIPEILNIEFTDVRHYHQIIKNGLMINGKNYVRLLTGAGMARRSTSMFCEESFYKIIHPILDNNRDKSVKLVDAKYNSYYALLSSQSLPVTVPRFCVIKDYEFSKERLVDFVVEVDGGDDYVEERLMPIVTNAFDGMGIISPQMALQWSVDLETDWVATSYCIRGSYLKGQVVVFDFHRFAEEVAHKYEIKDVWGNNVDIREVDCILTQSQLKMWNCYSSCEEYQRACDKNGIGWGVSRYTPEHEKDFFTSSYQLLQVLDLSEEELKDLAQPTIDWIEDVSGGNVEKTLLYLLGEISNREVEEGWWSAISDPILKALILNNQLIGDSYIKRHVVQSLEKKMQEAAMGNLVFNGNWQVSISDPYAFCEHAFGMSVRGLLSENEHYSWYWNQKGASIVASGRSPLTWKSEMNILNLQQRSLLDYWFGHIHSGVIFNIHGVDCMLMADGDFDYDINFSTSNEYFIKGASRGKPVTYEKKTASKNIIDESRLYLADVATMGSRIGLITNLSTTMYAMLPLFDKGSPEYEKLIERLIICRKLQGNEIDRAKSIIVKDLPKWDRWTKITNEMTGEEKKQADFNNRLMIWQRPRFMIYLYGRYMNGYRKYQDTYQNYSEILFGYDVEDLLNKEDKSQEEQKIFDNYYRYNTFLDTKSNMGIICNHVEQQNRRIKTNSRKHELDLGCYSIPGYEIDKKKLQLLETHCRYYKNNKKSVFNTNMDFKTVDQFKSYLLKQIFEKVSSDGKELAILGIELVKKAKTNADFVWQVLGNEIVDHLIYQGQKLVYIPQRDDFGSIEYLGRRYEMKGAQI